MSAMQVYGIAVNWAPAFAGVRGISWALRDTDLHRYDETFFAIIKRLLNKTGIKLFQPNVCAR